MAGGEGGGAAAVPEEGRSLALTPTWSVAIVLTLLVAGSLLIERSIHRLSYVSTLNITLINVVSLSVNPFVTCLVRLNIICVCSFFCLEKIKSVLMV